MFEFFGVQRPADLADAPVHHVRGRDDVGACARLIEGLSHQGAHGFVVDDLVAAHQPVLPVAGVGIKRHIGDDADLRDLLLDGAHGAAHEVLGVIGLGRFQIAQGGVGVGEEGEGGDAQFRAHLRRAHGLVDGEPVHAGHGGHGLPALFAVDDEDRPDQVIGGEHGLPHHPPRPFGAPVAAGAMGQIETGGLRIGEGLEG